MFDVSFHGHNVRRMIETKKGSTKKMQVDSMKKTSLKSTWLSQKAASIGEMRLLNISRMKHIAYTSIYE